MKIMLSLLLMSTMITRALSQCESNSDDCPFLITGTGEKLEPSGVVWLIELNLAIAVSDDSENAPGYELFYFDPNHIIGNKIYAFPLVSEPESRKYNLKDLEGLTWSSKTGEFFAISSLSLDADSVNPEDSWQRHQLIRFRIRRGEGGNLTAKFFERVSGNKRNDLREWTISSSDRQWTKEAYSSRAENGGINVEALAADSIGNLVIGFRGPIEANSAIALKINPAGQNEHIKSKGWLKLDLSALPGTIEEKQRGFRGLDLVSPNEPEEYVVILGHTGDKHHNLRLGIWDPRTGVFRDRGELPSGFVAEGVTVMKSDDKNVSVLIVSDLDAKVLTKTISR